MKLDRMKQYKRLPFPSSSWTSKFFLWHLIDRLLFCKECKCVGQRLRIVCFDSKQFYTVFRVNSLVVDIDDIKIFHYTIFLNNNGMKFVLRRF